MQRALLPYDVSLPASEPARIDATASLADALTEGDTRALAELYDRHHEDVRSLARRVVGEDAAAEDLVQEVFLSLPKVIRKHGGTSSMRSFLRGVTVNHARHHLRSAMRRRAAHERSRGALASAATPEDALHRCEVALAITRALDALSFDHRIAFILSEVEEHTAVEIGEILGVPEATVRTRVFHAKKKLRATLEKRGLAWGPA